MDRRLLEQIKKDKYYEYLKENSYYIKILSRNPNKYKEFKEFIKTKYHLRVTDKINTLVDDIELISSVIETLK